MNKVNANPTIGMVSEYVDRKIVFSIITLYEVENKYYDFEN